MSKDRKTAAVPAEAVPTEGLVGGLMPYADPVKLEAATKRRDEADYQCYMTGRELLSFSSDIRRLFEREGDAEKWDAFVAAIDERNEANEEVMKAMVANRP